MLVKFTTKHASSGLVTLVTHNGFAVLVFLPSCCVNSLLTYHTLYYSKQMFRFAGKIDTNALASKLYLAY